MTETPLDKTTDKNLSHLAWWVSRPTTWTSRKLKLYGLT